MKRLLKKLVASLLVMAMMLSSMTAYAAMEKETATQPRWSHLTLIRGLTEIDAKNKASITVTASCDDKAVNKLMVKCELQQLDGSWKTIKTWTESKDSNYISYKKYYAVAKNYSYRLKITASAYVNGSLEETVTEYFDYGYYK